MTYESKNVKLPTDFSFNKRTPKVPTTPSKRSLAKAKNKK